MEDVAASTLLSWITHSRGGQLPYCEDIQEALRRGPPEKVASCQQPAPACQQCVWAILAGGPLAPVKPAVTPPGLTPACSLMRYPEQGPSSRATVCFLLGSTNCVELYMLIVSVSGTCSKHSRTDPINPSSRHPRTDLINLCFRHKD